LKTLSVGVTGGIGSGKSEVCRVFESCGAVVFSADPLARAIIESDPAVKSRLRRLFGDEIYLPEGFLNRKLLARIIFTDPEAQARVNEAVHPAVIERLRKEIRRERELAGAPAVVVEAALIFEAKMEEMFDYIVVVEADDASRIARVTARDGVSADEVRDRMRSQLAPERKAAKADFVIRNTGDLAALKEQSRFIFRLLASISSES
jgi:dephospho-CoA kinase